MSSYLKDFFLLINILFGWSLILTPLVLILNTNDLFMYWLLIEVSFFRFLSLFNKEIFQEKEKILYFFVIQTVSSFLIIWRVGRKFLVCDYLIIFRLLIKLALIPASWWYFLIIKINNRALFFILTSQKIFYFFFISVILITKTFLFICLFSLWINIFLLNQRLIFNILVLSSIFNTLWLCLRLFVNTKLFWVYLIIYYTTLIFLFKRFYNENSVTSNKQSRTNKNFLILRVSGLPPFLLFWPKIFILIEIKIFTVGLIIVLIFSIFNIFIYLRSITFFIIMKAKLLKKLGLINLNTLRRLVLILIL